VFGALALLVAALLAPATAAGPLADQRICIDPGHGCSDPGAVNGGVGVREANVTLDVAYALKGLLEKDGATVLLTRTDDSRHSEAERYGFCNQHNATLLLSVHINAVADPQPNGALVLYYNDDEQALAQALYDAIYPAMDAGAPEGGFIPFGVLRFRAAVLRRSMVVGALVEPVFISNPTEAARLRQTIYDDPASGKVSAGCADLACRRGQIALAIERGLRLHFERAAAPAVGPTPTPAPFLQRAYIRPAGVSAPGLSRTPTPLPRPTATPVRPAPAAPFTFRDLLNLRAE
jgi:N-acetylmuramoyl-L-alanine amidase